MLFHGLVHLALVHPDRLGFHLFRSLAAAHDHMTDVARAGAAVDQPGSVLFLHEGAVVVRADDDIYATHALQQVKPLAFKHFSISFARAGMRQGDDQVGMLLRADAVHPFLHAGDQGLEFDAAPDRLVQPGAHVRVGEADHGHFQAAAAEYLVCREIGFPVGSPDGIGSQEGDAVRRQLSVDLVIDGVPGLDVVVAHGHGVVFHVGCQLDEEVLPFRVHVVVVIGGVVSLQAVAGVQEQDVLRSDGAAQAVHPGTDGHQAGLRGLSFDVRLVEPGSVDVARRDDVEGALRRGAGGYE